jgi:choline-sulfatase
MSIGMFRYSVFIVVTLTIFLGTACSEKHRELPKKTQLSQKTLPIKPNIVFIYTDDQAPWALGRSGNQQAITPNLDTLATEGIYLPNAYVTTPVCSPSRASLLTSQYAHELGITDWININPKAKTLSGHQFGLGLDTRFETWPEVLQTQGYYNGLIGKWHLGSDDKHHPTKHGYNEFIGFRKGGTTTSSPVLEVNKTDIKHEGLTIDVLTNYALEFIAQHQDKTFALSLHYRAPHYRFLPVAPEDAAPFEKMKIALPHPDYPDLNTTRATKLMREYLSSVKGIDRNVGRVLTVLDKLNLSENTVVIFTSDHGYTIGQNGIWHKGNGYWLLNTPPEGSKNVPSGQRPNLYDNSLKVPTIVRWPGHIKANTVNQSSMSNLDWFPTIISLAGGTAAPDNIIRGQNYIPAFLDENKILSSDYYASYSSLHQSLTDMRMYSDGEYKLIRDFKNSERDEFYHLSIDPLERNNLLEGSVSNEHAILIKNFDQMIIDKMRNTNDPVLNQLSGKLN